MQLPWSIVIVLLWILVFSGRVARCENTMNSVSQDDSAVINFKRHGKAQQMIKDGDIEFGRGNFTNAYAKFEAARKELLEIGARDVTNANARMKMVVTYVAADLMKRYTNLLSEVQKSDFIDQKKYDDFGSKIISFGKECRAYVAYGWFKNTFEEQVDGLLLDCIRRRLLGIQREISVTGRISTNEARAFSNMVSQISSNLAEICNDQLREQSPIPAEDQSAESVKLIQALIRSIQVDLEDRTKPAPPQPEPKQEPKPEPKIEQKQPIQRKHHPSNGVTF